MRRDQVPRLEEISGLLFDASPVLVGMSEEILGDLAEMAVEIHGCEQRRGSRTLEQVQDNVWATTIEMAAADVLGWERVSSHFDVRDRTTYAYDLRDRLTGETAECKRFSSGFLSVEPRTVRTLIRNRDLVDWVIAGDYTPVPDGFVVDFRLVADAKSFPDQLRESNFGSRLWYDHRRAHEVCRTRGL